jgi:hypothetical protein
MSPDQFALVVRTPDRHLRRLSTAPPHLEIGGRWISPGDLWRLDDITLRGYIPTDWTPDADGRHR